VTVLQIHNFYRWLAGEDEAVRATSSLLIRNGIDVREIFRDSRTVAGGVGERIALAARSVWSRSAYREVRNIISETGPDVAHVHNVYPMLSPAVISACADSGVPVVMTCHNYRLLCPTAGVFRNGEICTKCTGAGGELWCVAHNCRGSLAESTAYAVRSAAARTRGTFVDGVTRYITPSRFTARAIERIGIPEDRIDVVPCMIPRGEDPPPSRQPGDYVAFAGRLCEEKGVHVLLRAAARTPDIPFLIAGSGPLDEECRGLAPGNVGFVGRLDATALADFYRGARMVVVPSLWYETFGIVPAEAMSHAVPVVASRFGALEELVLDGETGLLFERGSDLELAAKVTELWARPDRCIQMGARGRAKVVSECSEEAHLQGLLAAYGRAMEGIRGNGRVRRSA
jgi:glycosyltransferase involved in cell wall biosynthesis